MKKPWFTIKQIHNNVYAIAEFSHWEQVASYLFVDKLRAFLIDTGMGYASIKNEIVKITTLPITVLLTHAHWDHIGGAADFEKIYIFNDKFEKESLEHGFYSNDIAELNNPQMYSNGYLPKQYVVPGIKMFHFLNEKVIHSDNYDIEVVHTPGHTPGSVCFYIPKLNLLFTGDTLYPGPLYAQLPESNLQDYTKSILKLSKLFKPDLLILPGHNAVTAQSQLLMEASRIFAKLAKSNPVEPHTEIMGKLLSIKT